MSAEESQFERLKYASLVAHQLKGPVATAAMLLKTLLGEFAGPLNDQQKDLVSKALARCEQALGAAERMLAIARASDSHLAVTSTADLAALIRKVWPRHVEESRRAHVSLALDMGDELAVVRGYEPAMTEVLDALLSNAFKYTPEHGRVVVSLSPDAGGGGVLLAVSDSGVGIAADDREKVFEPFHRTARATGSARSGTGLGLAFVKSVVEAAGGRVWAEPSEFGGARIVLCLPRPDHAPAAQAGGTPMPARLRVVIVGGSVAGPKAASKIIRLMPDAEVTIVEQSQFLACAGCGLPYYMSGVVGDPRGLLSTPAGAVRDPVFFQSIKNVRVMNQTEALAIDRAERTVRVRDGVSGAESALVYDKLILTTGSVPTIPPIPGSNLHNVVTLHGLKNAERIKSALAGGKARDVVIVGGGILGVEITQNLVEKGCRVTIVERRPQPLPILDAEMAALVEQHLESKGVRMMTRTAVQAFKGDGKVREVLTDRGLLPADLVILAIGFRPNVKLAENAGLVIGTTGAIKVDEMMRTSDPDIYAAGDCVETRGLITGKARYVPYGSVASKQGRVAAVNVCGGSDRFPGVLASAVCKVFEYCVARTGLSEYLARECGFDVVSVLVPGPDREPFMPNAKMLLLKLVVDRATRRLLGAQAVGPGLGEKRIDLAATAIIGGMTVDQIACLDLTYAPPYSSVMDNLITAANVARNKLDGHMVGVSPAEVRGMLDEKREFVFLDVRTPGEHEQIHLAGSTFISLGALRGRLDELPRDREIVVFSKLSLRAYEASIILRHAGFRQVRVMDGGIEMWPYDKVR
ncbi:MAG: FAD-dependent oxidoreductase [Phycisphaerae bacterium]|nr:FAD-dependent oxidoreductase [Phycisphaerae bacterium]